MANLITLAEYKAYAGIKSTEQDDKINALITSVSSFVKMYCNRSFIDYFATPKVEYYGQGYDLIYLSEQPIVQDTAGNPQLTVEVKAYVGDTYTTASSDIDYIYDYEIEALRSLYSDGFPAFPNAIKVTYQGGFDQTPEDLKLGIFDLITYYMKGESTPRKSINSNQISVEYVKSSDLPAHIKRVFDLYRSITT
jgi:hypothetical protein